MRERAARYVGVVAAAVRNRRIRIVLFAFLLFSVAEWSRWVALLVVAFRRGGPAGASIITIAQLGPVALLTPFSSSLADRYPRGRVLAAAYALAGLSDLVAGVALVAGLPFAVVGVLAAFAMVGITLVRPTQNSLLPSLADDPEDLTAGNVTASFIVGSSLLLGPLAAAAILEVGSSAGVLFATAAALVIGGVIVWRVLGSTRTVHAGERADARGGFRELRANAAARSVVVLLALQAVVWGMADVLIVTLAIRELDLGPSGPGLLSAALGVGGVLGGAASIALVGREGTARALAVGVVLWSAPLVAIAAVLLPVPVAIALAVAGIGFTVLDAAARTLLQRAVPDERLGRVFGLLEASFMGAWGLGAALAPGTLHALGTRGTFVAAGLLLPLASLATRRTMASLDRAAPASADDVELLRGIDLFAPLPERILEGLARNLIPIDVAPGDTVIRQGDVGDRFYVIAEGDVVVTTDDVEVARFARGDHIGEVALLRDVPRTATVTALTRARVLALDRRPFLRAVTGSDAAVTAAHASIDRRMGTAAPR
jgi:MFS family permease